MSETILFHVPGRRLRDILSLNFSTGIYSDAGYKAE